MTRQEHHIRQMKWFETLSNYGKAEIEPCIRIRNAEIFPDVYAEIDEKKYIIEIGDVDDKRKEALIQLYAEQNENIIFVHEDYGEDKIDETLTTIRSFRESPQYAKVQERVKQREKEEKDARKRKIRITLAVYGLGIPIFIAFIWFLNNVILKSG